MGEFRDSLTPKQRDVYDKQLEKITSQEKSGWRKRRTPEELAHIRWFGLSNEEVVYDAREFFRGITNHPLDNE